MAPIMPSDPLVERCDDHPHSHGEGGVGGFIFACLLVVWHWAVMCQPARQPGLGNLSNRAPALKLAVPWYGY